MEIPSTSQRLSESENEEETVEDDVFEDQNELFTKLDKTEPAHSFLRYFQFARGAQKAKCRICCKHIARKGGNTSGMDRHLKRHSKAYKDFLLAKSNKSSQKNMTICSEEVPKKTPVKQMKLDEFRLKEKWPNDHPKSKKIDELIVRFVCLSCDAISLTEKNGFSELFEEACPSRADNPLSNFLFPTSCGSVDSTQSQNDLSNVIINEIDSFFKSPTIEFDADPLVFWRGNSTYPNIKQIVSKYLAPPPGTVESERTFSQLSEIFSPKRSSLSSKHAMQQIFLHFNFDE